jgi:NTP pyrophosphatase (non-canonical NTP hydrolase)
MRQSDPKRMEGIRDEVADVMIYLLFLSNDLGIDISEAIRAKVLKNEEKYPASEYRGRF